MIQVPRRRLGWRVTAGILAALLSAPARWRTPTETDAGCVSCAPATSRRMFPYATLTSWGFSTASRDGGQRPDACQQGSRTTWPCRL